MIAISYLGSAVKRNSVRAPAPRNRRYFSGDLRSSPLLISYMRSIAITLSVAVIMAPVFTGQGDNRPDLPSEAVINKQNGKRFGLSPDAVIVGEQRRESGGQMLVTAKKVETIVDDDEGLSSFYVAWLDAGGYYSVARERGEDVIYCELNDQSSGFYSKTVKYTITGRRIKFWVSDDEYFDGPNRINEIEIVIPDKVGDIEQISSCLKFIFGTA